jgi:outer membrane protein TolC
MAPGTDRLVKHWRRATTAAVLGLLTAGPVAAQAPPLPRVDEALTMEQAVDLALQKNLRIRAAQADSRVMESMRREALGPFWPQLSANGYVNDQNLAPNVYSSAGTTMARNTQVFLADRTQDANLTAMYSLFSGGRDYYGYKAATARADAGRLMLRGAQVDVAMQVRLDYIGALREAENVRVTGDLQRQVEERLRVTREAFDAGRVPQFYVLRDEAELTNAVQMDAMARSRAGQALVALKTTLGIDLGSTIALVDRLAYTPVTVSVEEAIRAATDVHPDAQAVAKQRQAAEAEVRAAYGNYWPQVGVAAMYDWVRMKAGGGPTESDQGYSVGLVITLPIFDGFMRENAVRTAKSKLDRATQADGLVRQQVAKEVSQTALMLAAAEKSVEASQKGLEQAEEEFRIVRERFAAGRGIQLEILDAQANHTRARFNAVAALADYQTALAMWRRAIGEIR